MFQVDAREGKLCRNGIPVRIREQSFRVLVLLLKHAGELVTRDQLRSALWPSDTFVDFEHGLNTAVMKLREALDDPAEAPFYIETVPKRGYRFIAPLAAQSDTQEKPANPGPEFIAPAFNGPGDPEHAAVDAAPTPRIGRSYARIAAAVGLVLILAATLILLNVRGWRERFFARPPQVHALAVLPFTNLSEDPKQEYFSDGITEALITELGRIAGPRVVSRQSIMQFKGSKKSMDQIARELKVDAIIEGAVERSGDRVRITVHLAQGNPERQLWAEQYDRDIRDVLAVQGDIARSVANEICAILPIAIQSTLRLNQSISRDSMLRGIPPSLQKEPSSILKMRSKKIRRLRQPMLG
jgi:TolB-like protein/DNA-binding winged helix-turn-helix (wHTH) protein